MMVSAEVVLFSVDPQTICEIEELAQRFQLRVVKNYPANQPVLVLNNDRLELHLPDTKVKPLYVDFTEQAVQKRLHQSRGRTEMIARAVGIKGTYRPRVIDATAGLGADGVVLAHLGCFVQMVERSPVIFMLLENGFKRAERHKFEWLSRITVIFDDAKHFLHLNIENAEPIDVVYLDPMFPERVKSALVKKEMRILKQLVGEDPDADELFELAKHCANKRVVIKRPKLAKPLANQPPSFSFKAKACRFDVYDLAGAR
jgi:16S rRNA (guanine1516-N2)-methyltransferase